jgi:hypothetical protein
MSGNRIGEQPRADDEQAGGVADVMNDDIDQNEDVDRPIPNLDLHEVFVDPKLPEVAP